MPVMLQAPIGAALLTQSRSPIAGGVQRIAVQTVEEQSMPGTEGRPSSSRSSCSALAALSDGPAVGVRPSRSAFLMSAAFHAA